MFQFASRTNLLTKVNRRNNNFVKSSVGRQNRTYAQGKDLKYADEARSLMLKGVTKLAKAVAVTLGPKGRNVIIEQSFGSPKITKDGVTVAKHIEFANPHYNLGASMVRDVASKTNDEAGDGTTTATILTQSIFSEGCKAVAAGMNPMDLKRGIDLAVQSVVESLEEQKKPVQSQEEITQVATISANGDSEIGELISLAMENVGREGVITVDEGATLKNELEVVEGMRFDRGYISPYFITDTKTLKCEYDDPLILIHNKKIGQAADIIKALEVAAQSKKPLVIIAEDIEGDALATLLVNKMRANLRVVAMKAPGFGDNRSNNLQDIAVITGGTLITEDLGLKLDEVTLGQLGSCQKITVTKDETIIFRGSGEQADINERCDQLRETITNGDLGEYEQEKMNERLAKMSDGVAILKIGGSSEVEVNEKKDRVTDALNATRAAVVDGIVPGGGTALLNAAKAVDDLKVKAVNLDQKVGIEIIENAIQYPIKQICQNAGVEGAVIVDRVANHEDGQYGYNAATGEFGNMFDMGVVDPTKVVRTALVDAASVASLLTTSECMITDIKDDKADVAPPMGGGMGGGMGGMGGMGGGMF